MYHCRKDTSKRTRPMAVLQVVVQVYLSEKREAVDAWGRFLAKLVGRGGPVPR